MAKKEAMFSELNELGVFSTRLSEAMAVLGDNKSSLARKTGLSEAAIRGYLKGRSSPSIEQLMKISKVTGISAAWFLGEQDSPHVQVDTIEADQSLLMMLIPHLCGAQRQVILSQILSALAKQYNEIYDISAIRDLSSSVIGTALKINGLSAEEKQAIEVLLDKNE